MEDFGQRDCSVSTLQTPPYKSAWICSKEWVSCGSNTGWAGSDKELAAGWQAVYHLGKHEDNRAGRRTFCKICPSWAPSALTTWLADCSSLSLCPQKPTWKDRVPALLSAFESWEYRNGSWGTEGLQRLSLRRSQRRPLVGGRECWVDGPWTPKRSAFFVPEMWPCHPNTTCPELYFHCVLPRWGLWTPSSITAWGWWGWRWGPWGKHMGWRSRSSSGPHSTAKDLQASKELFCWGFLCLCTVHLETLVHSCPRACTKLREGQARPASCAGYGMWRDSGGNNWSGTNLSVYGRCRGTKWYQACVSTWCSSSRGTSWLLRTPNANTAYIYLAAICQGTTDITAGVFKQGKTYDVSEPCRRHELQRLQMSSSMLLTG